MKLAIEEKKPVVDVDGSYVYRKYKSLVDAGECFALPPCPSPPLSGWKVVTEENHLTIAPSIPPVTQGHHALFIYLFIYFYACRLGVYILGWSRWTCW